ncbi:TonB-dependent receptor [Sphingomonas sp.]|jgi:outer membrane receptor protein involved in Fe transport|uniref:TonB-dependent receptor n=1 Tax=Sphingomonas sp. TaxID=28214 RepID=UPI002D803C41|nr:TonB-dependent receptor plug domain-containing protein [Sphingomonas sp.]HEU0043510.1 TonB-dependent receptor plug domain-containing protein [Sphingomonas sp.]
MTLAIGWPAFAQTAEPGALAGDATAQVPSQGLEDIIVTAQRRSESLQRAAVAVDVVTAGDLAAAGVVTATTLNAAVPSLSVQQGGGANNVFFIRGVGNFTLNGYSDPAIAFDLDGVYMGRPTSTTATFFDLERIEVLKGPQGTLYGRNATGGAVNVIPVRPRIHELSVAASAGYGNYNASDLEAVVNVPLGPLAAFRIAGKLVDRDGYNQDGTLDDVGHGVRAQLLFQPTDRLNIRLAADYSHQDGAGPGGSYLGHELFTAGARHRDLAGELRLRACQSRSVQRPALARGARVFRASHDPRATDQPRAARLSVSQQRLLGRVGGDQLDDRRRHSDGDPGFRESELRGERTAAAKPLGDRGRGDAHRRLQAGAVRGPGAACRRRGQACRRRSRLRHVPPDVGAVMALPIKETR